ncbi:MAG TPA: hypothetical protein DCO89_00805 [Clostridiales bacterium]|nr:hypothetical protein [Clostridiales bacterium]
MVKKVLWATIITIVLFAIVIAEQVFVDNTLNMLIEKISSLDAYVSSTENIQSAEIIDVCNNLDEFWTEREKILCLFINHNELSKIGEQIKKVKVYIEKNNKDDCEYELDTLNFYAESYKHVVEINIQNLL